MNDERRKAIDNVKTEINKLIAERDMVLTLLDEKAAEITDIWHDVKLAVERLTEHAADISGMIEEISDAEQEAYDNMPEGIQQGERGEKASTAIEALILAHDTLDDLAGLRLDDLEIPEEIDGLSTIEDADASLDEAASV